MENPKDCREDYDKVISMLELTVDTIIELTDREFGCIVLDQWEWRTHSRYLNSQYMSQK